MPVRTMARLQLRRYSFPSLTRGGRCLCSLSLSATGEPRHQTAESRVRSHKVYTTEVSQLRQPVNFVNGWTDVVQAGKREIDRVHQYLDQLSDDQKKAATSSEKVTRVIAGPGSGKTRVLVARAMYLIADGASPGSLMLLTFTNKAAMEMKSRLTSFFEDDRKLADIWCGTFHSIALRILRQNVELLKDGRNTAFQITDDNEMESVILGIYLRKEAIPIHADDTAEVKAAKKKQTTALRKVLKEKSKELQRMIHNAKEKLPFTHGLSGTDVVAELEKEHFSFDGPVNDFIWCFDQYQQRMNRLNLFDFGDLIGCVVWLLKNNKRIRDRYRNRFRHIFVDEMQDTNRPQYEFLRLLTMDRGRKTTKRNCLFTVGDPNQSIYAFRGAQAQNMSKQMDKDFKGMISTRHLLENFRSQAQIVRCAEKVLRSFLPDSMYVDMKTIRPMNSTARVQCIRFSNQKDEARYIVNEISQLQKQQGIAFKDIAIFYRSHFLSRHLEPELIDAELPYFIVGPSFWERKEVKDIIGYLRFACNPNDLLAFERIVNTPSRGIGAKSLNSLKEWCLKEQREFPSFIVSDLLSEHTDAKTPKEVEIAKFDLPKDAGVSAKAKQGLHSIRQIFVYLRSVARDACPGDVIKSLLDDCGYRDFVDPDPSKVDPTVGVVLENIDALVDMGKSGSLFGFEESSVQGLDALRNFAQETSVYLDVNTRRNRDGVQLMTVHAAKGLEFKVVFVVGCEDGVFPSHQSTTSLHDLQEEARLMFVAITRAKDHLALIYVDQRFAYGRKLSSEPSRFIDAVRL